MVCPVHDILIVDDDPADLDLTRLGFELSREDVRVHTAADGEQALAWLDRQARRRRLPDLVLLDYNMPRMRGDEVLEAIGRDAALLEVPTVVLTTSTSTGERRRCLDLGAVDVVVKPANFRDLMGLLDRLTRDLLPIGEAADD